MGSNPWEREIEWLDEERGDDWTMFVETVDQYSVACANGITEPEERSLFF